MCPPVPAASLHCWLRWSWCCHISWTWPQHLGDTSRLPVVYTQSCKLRAYNFTSLTSTNTLTCLWLQPPFYVQNPNILFFQLGHPAANSQFSRINLLQRNMASNLKLLTPLPITFHLHICLLLMVFTWQCSSLTDPYFTVIQSSPLTDKPQWSFLWPTVCKLSSSGPDHLFQRRNPSSNHWKHGPFPSASHVSSPDLTKQNTHNAVRQKKDVLRIFLKCLLAVLPLVIQGLKHAEPLSPNYTNNPIFEPSCWRQCKTQFVNGFCAVVR